MKALIILVLVVIGYGAFAFTRPTSDDFQTYVKAHPEIAQGQVAQGDSIADKLSHQIKTFAGVDPTGLIFDPVKDFLSQCQYENHFYLWTDVRQNGNLIYTGVLGHWFKRGSSTTTQTTAQPTT